MAYFLQATGKSIGLINGYKLYYLLFYLSGNKAIYTVFQNLILEVPSYDYKFQKSDLQPKTDFSKVFWLDLYCCGDIVYFNIDWI